MAGACEPEVTLQWPAFAQAIEPLDLQGVEQVLSLPTLVSLQSLLGSSSQGLSALQAGLCGLL